MQREVLSSIYRSHHERGDRYGYLYCGGERGRYLAEWIGKGKKVLDLGCRDGALTSYYAAGNDVLGVDVDAQGLQLCRQKLGIETQWLDLNTEWPFAPNSFDVIVACEILEHLFFLDHFIHHVTSTLKQGGLFIGSVPNAFRMRNRLKFLLGFEYETDPTHVRQFSYGRLSQFLSRHFADVTIFPIQGSVLPFLPVSSSLPSGVNRLFAKDLLWRSGSKAL